MQPLSQNHSCMCVDSRASLLDPSNDTSRALIHSGIQSSLPQIT